MGCKFISAWHNHPRRPRTHWRVMGDRHRPLLGTRIGEGKPALATAGKLDIDLRQQLAVQQRIMAGAG